jgi:serine/threonine protein kinase
VISIISQLFKAFKIMRENQIFHKDLKLENIYVSDKSHIKVGDFGTAQILKYSED